jgi:DNA-binding response OmpR family regulator
LEAAIFGGSRVMIIDLSGRSILIVEDEPLIAMDIAAALQSERATVRIARTLHDAFLLVEEPGLSVAIIDLALGRETAAALCNRLAELKVPFIIYTGYPDIPAECKPDAVVQKPADPATIVRAVAALVR